MFSKSSFRVLGVRPEVFCASRRRIVVRPPPPLGARTLSLSRVVPVFCKQTVLDTGSCPVISPSVRPLNCDALFVNCPSPRSSLHDSVHKLCFVLGRVWLLKTRIYRVKRLLSVSLLVGSVCLSRY